MPNDIDTHGASTPSSTDLQTRLRQIPSVDRLLDSPAFAPLHERFARALLIEAVRGELGAVRAAIVEGRDGAMPDDNGLASRVEVRLMVAERPYYRRVINATGVVLHTGLGRARLPSAATQALATLAEHPQRVEVSLETGARGGRDQGCAALLTQLLDCEAATVVNNNAAATLVILAALARGRGVALSRGEMVAIGGSYRVPEIMEESGARLVDVGTTNRTRLADYERALARDDADVAMLLKVHTSNYRVIGFTEEVAIGPLATLGAAHGVPVVHDLGSGSLIDLTAYHHHGEPLVRASLDAGADLVCFSGDKLLGGPQAGIIAGKAKWVERCRRHPLFRSLRPGRLVYTALEATLRLYREGDDAARASIPALRRLTADAATLRTRAEALAEHLCAATSRLNATVEPCRSQAGSGSMPGRDLASWAVRVVPKAGGVDAFAAALRAGEPSVVGRIHEDTLWLDVRTMGEEDDALVVDAVSAASR